MTPIIQIERSLSYSTSIKSSLSFSKFSTQYLGDDFYISNIGDALITSRGEFEGDIRQSGEISGSISGFTISFDYSTRRYFTKWGAIAPFGRFFEFGLKGNVIKLQESAASLPISDGQNDYILFLEHNPKTSVSFNSGFHLLLGEKRFVNDKNFLEYSIGLDIDGVGFRTTFNSHTNIAHSQVRENFLLPSFLKLNLIYGIAK